MKGQVNLLEEIIVDNFAGGGGASTRKRFFIDRDYKGNVYGKTKQVARCGNAVPPPFATALVRANLPEWCDKSITTMAEFKSEVAV